jgi:hypothetical protein
MAYIVANKYKHATTVFLENRTAPPPTLWPGPRLAAGVSIEPYTRKDGSTNPHLIAWEAVPGVNKNALITVGWSGWLVLPDGGEIEVTWDNVLWEKIAGLHPALTRASALADKSNWGWDTPEFITVCQELGLSPMPPRIETLARLDGISKERERRIS